MFRGMQIFAICLSTRSLESTRSRVSAIAHTNTQHNSDTELIYLMYLFLPIININFYYFDYSKTGFDMTIRIKKKY